VFWANGNFGGCLGSSYNSVQWFIAPALSARHNAAELKRSLRLLNGSPASNKQSTTAHPVPSLVPGIAHLSSSIDAKPYCLCCTGCIVPPVLQVVEKLYRQSWTRLDGLGALVLTPTRELAMQIFEELVKVSESLAGRSTAAAAVQQQRSSSAPAAATVAKPWLTSCD
jgi:hypothetical protein